MLVSALRYKKCVRGIMKQFGETTVVGLPEQVEGEYMLI